MPTPVESPAPSAWEALERAMAEARALGGALTLLQWDFETYMPPAGGEARGEQLAALQGILHERLVAPALGEALERADAEVGVSRRTASSAPMERIGVLEFSYRNGSTSVPAPRCTTRPFT